MKFNPTAAANQLAALGYEPSGTIHLTAFLPKISPDLDKNAPAVIAHAKKTKADKGRKASGKLLDLVPTIETWVEEGRGVYLVVNGAHLAADVTECRAVFYEHDDLDKADQVGLWKILDLPEPTLQIDSGGKSIHSYWTLTEAIAPDDWRKLQTDLLNYADADRSLKNPNRVMRLAGAPHFALTNDGVIQDGTASILNAAGTRYSYYRLRKLIPEPAPTEPPPRRPLMIVEDPRDEDERVLSALNAIPRRAPGTGTYEESVRVLMALQAHYGPDKGLQMAQRWSPDEDWGEKLDRKINGMKGDGVKLGTLYQIAKQHGWKDPRTANKPTNIIPMRSTAPTVPTVKPDATPHTVTSDSDNAGDSQSPDPASVLATVTAVTAILENHDSEGERGIALDALAKHRGVSRRSLDLVIREIEGKAEIKESKPPMAPKSEDFDLKMLFGERLATAMEAAAASASIDPMMIAHYFLGAAGSVIGGKTRAWVGGDHTEPAIYWPVIVEASGEGKTRAYNFVSQWFKKRQAEENKAYEIRKADYEAKAAKWKRDSGKGAGEDTPPERPAPKHQVLINQATTEALIKALANNNGRGALMFRDEFSGTFKMGQYKKAGGDDEETLLELYDGGTINVLRASEEGSLFAECSHACFAGGTQPDIFREIFADLNDSRGKQARFSFLVPKQCPPVYNENRHITLELPSLLDHIYGEILKKAAISPEKINLSDQAFHHWRQYANRIKGEARAASTPPVLRTWLNKHANRAVRIALDLHFIDAALGQNDGDAISLNTIKRAIAFCEFLRSQFEFLQRQADTEGVEGVVSLIQSKTRAYGSIKARDFYRTHCKAGIAAIAKDQGRATAAVTKELMEKAAQSDGFTVVQDGNSYRLEFSPQLGSVAKDEKVGDSGDSGQDIDIPTVTAVTDTGPVTGDSGDSDPKSETENPESENKESENKDQEFTPKEGDDVWAWTALVDDPDLKEQWVQAQYLQIEPDGDQHMVVIGGLGYYVHHVRPIPVEAVHGD